MLERLQERPNPNPSNSFETLSLNGEVVFSKELTLRELLGLRENKATNRVGFDDVGLADVPFAFEVRDLGDFLLNIASFSGEQPLGRQRFLNLLSAAKSGGSSRMGQSRSGITDDWDIILPEVRARIPRKKELYDHHKENVPHFSEYEKNHFQKFWDVINAPSVEIINILLDKQVRRFISEERLTLHCKQAFLGSDESNLIRMTGWDEYRVLTIEFLKDKGYDLGNLTDDIKGCSDVLTSLFLRFNELTREEFQREWYDYLVFRKRERQMAIDASRVLNYSFHGHFLGEELIVVDRNGNLSDTFMTGPPFKFEADNRLLLYGVYSIDKLNNGQIKVSTGESYIIIDFVADEEGIRMPVIKEKRYGPNLPSYLSPLIIWKRDKETGNASYFCGQIPQELIQSHPHLFSQRHDTLLGQLGVSAYSSKARDQMPKEIRMMSADDREVTQQMLEAQSVLLVPMNDQLFLEQSPVILGLEKLRTVDRT